MASVPAPRGVFYGWWVVAASVACLALSWPVIALYNFGPFVIPLSREFGWNRGEISAAVTVVSWSATLMSLLLGVIVDRVGVRRVMLPSITALAATVGSLYWLTSSLLHFYISFFLIAVLGAGTSVLAYSKLILNWFDTKRGLALGFTMAGVGIGAMILPVITTEIISSFGWRTAYLCLGIAILLISGGICAGCIREHPHELGLHKDGAARDHIAPPRAPVNIGYSVREAVQTRPFWLMLSAFFLVGFCATASTIHLVPLMQDRGIDAVRAAQTASALGFAVIFGRILAGYLMDRFFAPYVAIGFMMGPVLGLSLLALGAVGTLAYVAAILIGLAIGAEFDILGYFTSRYGGLKSFGVLYGFMLASFQLGGGIGPYVMGVGFDRTGSYTAILWTFVACFLATCCLIAMLGPYPRFEAPQPRGP